MNVRSTRYRCLKDANVASFIYVIANIHHHYCTDDTSNFLTSVEHTPSDASMSTPLNPAIELTHLQFLEQALAEARKSPLLASNFRVGCVIVSLKSPTSPAVLSTGYTLELKGNTHAEQCALTKLATSLDLAETSLSSVLPESVHAILYTTLEPCGKRLSGNTPCVQRIIATRVNNPEGGIRKVIFGAKEPGTFVQDSQSCRMLTEAGVEWEYIEGLDEEILQVAMEGHKPRKDQEEQKGVEGKRSQSSEQSQGTNVDSISPEERERQDAQPRNPMKRMMEALPGSN